MADGDTPPLPIEPRTFSGFATCRAFLDRTYKEDHAKANPAPVPAENGTSQTLIDTRGPRITSPGHAIYEVTEGWNNRTPKPEIRQIMTTYSYRRTQMRCDGSRLTGENFTGYGLEGYEAMPASQGG